METLISFYQSLIFQYFKNFFIILIVFAGDKISASFYILSISFLFEVNENVVNQSFLVKYVYIIKLPPKVKQHLKLLKQSLYQFINHWQSVKRKLSVFQSILAFQFITFHHKIRNQFTYKFKIQTKLQFIHPPAIQQIMNHFLLS